VWVPQQHVQRHHVYTFAKHRHVWVHRYLRPCCESLRATHVIVGQNAGWLGCHCGAKVACSCLFSHRSGGCVSTCQRFFPLGFGRTTHSCPLGQHSALSSICEGSVKMGAEVFRAQTEQYYQEHLVSNAAHHVRECFRLLL
jgi:hypothetical protein